MKKHMKRVMTGAMLALVMQMGMSNVQAADRGETRKGAADRIQRFRENVRRTAAELNLSDDQKAKLREIFAGEREVLIELRDDDSLPRREKIAKFREIRAHVIEAIREVLTPEQWDLWQKLREDQREGVRRQVED